MESDYTKRKARTSSRIIKKSKFHDEAGKSQSKEYRPCDKTSCGEMQPFCNLQASDNCARDGYTSRWYHMSLGEHFCNECFDHFYRPHKSGHWQYRSWCGQWFSTSTLKPSIKRFVADEVLPFWFQCTLPQCQKWREVRHPAEVTPDFVHNFQCNVVYQTTRKNPCDIEEEPCVSALSKPEWIGNLTEMPLLKNSPASPQLLQFQPEGLGVYPIGIDKRPNMPKWIEPFNEEIIDLYPVSFHPTVMDVTEATYFPEYVMGPVTYIGLRNLIVAVWYLHPSEWLTTKRVSMHLICRGLIRVYLLQKVENIIRFLTQRCIINFGIISPHFELTLHSEEYKPIVIIGAGTAGLAAAKHLHNLNIKTIIFEASSRIGGRIWDDSIPKGAHIIYGLTNNPFTILAHQTKLTIEELSSDAAFIIESGRRVSAEVIDRMSHQFGGMMHGALEWAQEEKKDCNWFDTICQHQKDFPSMTPFSAEENQLFDLFLKIHEIESRIAVKELTLYEYEFPKASGSDGMVIEGLSLILNKLAEGLDIRFNTEVLSVNYINNEVEIETADGNVMASRVIVAVPFSVLRNDQIVFEPPLPEKKVKAMNELGEVTFEQVILQFSEKFWANYLEGSTKKLGIVSEKNLVFQYFIDISDLTEGDFPTLLTFITNSNADSVKKLKDSEIIKMCIDVLEKVFKNFGVAVPTPSNSYVTHWSSDPHTGSSGNFVKVGSSYDVYDEIAEPVNEILFFAGDAMYRKCPNSITGAYISGLQASMKVSDILFPFVPSYENYDLAEKTEKKTF